MICSISGLSYEQAAALSPPGNILGMAILPLCIRAETPSSSREIPGPLRGWEQWATWDDADRVCPTPYRDPEKALCFWPSRLTLNIEPTFGRFELEVTVFSESWLPLPGDEKVWPLRSRRMAPRNRRRTRWTTLDEASGRSLSNRRNLSLERSSGQIGDSQGDRHARATLQGAVVESPRGMRRATCG